MKKETDPKYIVWNDGECIEGMDLADLKFNLDECYGHDVEEDDPWMMPLYKLVGKIKLEKPKAPLLKFTLPKGA